MKYSDEYLYGEDAEVPSIPSDIIVRRVELLRDNLEELLDQSYYIRDLERVSAVVRSIDFWEKMNKDD